MTAGVHCEKFPDCMVVGDNATMPTCTRQDCPGVQRIQFAAKLGAAMLAKPEPQTEDENTLEEMRAQLWAAGLDLEESQFIARMLWRNGQRIVPIKTAE
jgi:hypothetical protein